MRLPRFTTRRLMVLVAVVGMLRGFGIEAMRLSRISAEHRSTAEGLAFDEAGLREALEVGSRSTYRGPWFDLDVVRRELDRIAALRREHERAARYPWLPVPPDPPPPVSAP